MKLDAASCVQSITGFHLFSTSHSNFRYRDIEFSHHRAKFATHPVARRIASTSVVTCHDALANRHSQTLCYDRHNTKLAMRAYGAYGAYDVNGRAFSRLRQTHIS